MKYKLIAVDLDGTLYNDQLKITSDTLNTMIKAQEMGIRIALASGRPLLVFSCQRFIETK